VDTAKDRVKWTNVSIEEFVGTGQRVAALLKVTAETVDGKIYNENGDTSGCIFQVKDGKINEIFFFPDTTLIETVLYNRRYVPN
jgi:ketosteroid isomerase-like protein